MSIESDGVTMVAAPSSSATEKSMRFPAWREVGEPNQVETPNTTVIGRVVKLVTVPYAGTEPATEVIVRPLLSDYAELPVDV
jgi:hypothetical protein